MALNNSWVGYLDRSFKNIKSSVLDRMKTLVPEMTDHSESNIFVIIVSIFAGLTEQLNYYIDNIARESYITTARRYSSIVKLTRLIDYRVRAKVASTVDLKITAVDATGNPVNLVNNYTIPINLVVTDSAGIEFLIVQKKTILANTSAITVPARQVTQVSGQNIGVTDSSINQSFALSVDYEEGSLQITINLQTWELRETLAYSGPLDRHFIVEVNESKEAWVVFGDNINGAVPTSGLPIYATYYETKGLDGNVEANTLTFWDAAPAVPTQVPAISQFTITNPVSAAGGIDEEGIEGIRRHAPLSIRTLNRAVTFQDHKDIAELVPGVGKAAVKLDDTSKQIIIYIAPSEGGVASGSLLTEVNNEFLIKGMIGTTVIAKEAGETIIRMGLNITAKFRRDPNDTEADVLAALINEFGFNGSTVNRQVRRSDIIALIDNLDKVDFLNITYITTKPYPRVNVGANSLENNWNVTVNEESNKVMRWRLGVSTPTTARLYGMGEDGYEYFDGEVTIHAADPGVTDYTTDNSEISISVWGNFNVGDQWIFHSYPYNEDIELVDYSIPVIRVDELSITINEQLVP